MCDTFILFPEKNKLNTMILAKNSDRPSFDCQPLIFNKSKDFKKNEYLQLEYIKIPQVEHTYTTMGCSPYWCYGYEMGVNEFNVAIGNEAIFTKECRSLMEDKNSKLGILGMDLIRIALERSKTAFEAVEIMIKLIGGYGQFGSAVPQANHTEGSYDNSFIIADYKRAYCLETAGKHWVLKEINDNFYNISNELSIREDYNICSNYLINNALYKGFIDNEKNLDFAYAYTDEFKPLQVSHIRYQRIKNLLEKTNKLTIKDIYKILRDHYEDTFLEGPNFNAAYPDFHTICMHESPANFTWGITAGSAVIILPTHTAPIFLWAPATPCTSIYSAFFLDSKDLPESVSKTGNIPKCINPPINSQIDSFNEQSYWWQFKDLLDLAKGDQFGSKFNITKPIIRAVFDPLEDEIIDNVNSYINNNTTKLDITGFQFYEVKEVEKRLNTLKKIISNLNGL